MRNLTIASGLLAALLLASCSTPLPPPPDSAPEPAPDRTFETSFDCGGVEARWQAYACRDAALAAADRDLRQSLVAQLRAQDLAGRADLLADQHHWQLGLNGRCAIDSMPMRGSALPAAPLACLLQAWRQRDAALKAWPMPAIRPWDPARGDQPLAAYVAFREVVNLAPELCADAQSRLGRLIAGDGDADPGRSPGWRSIAGSHGGTASATMPNGSRVDIAMHDAGPYGGFEWRPLSMAVDGSTLIDDRTLPAWLLELPNAEGSFTSTSSATRDYRHLDVFQDGPRTLVLVLQPWGYYAAAARGESPHAALFELVGSTLQRRCLWRTYTAQPVARMLRFLPKFKALQDVLDEASGPDSPNLAPDDRRDATLLYLETQWRLLNLPLVEIDGVDRAGRGPLLQQRNDEALESLFAWSERNVACKLLYRRLMPLIAPAHEELVRSFSTEQALPSDAARRAADFVLMFALARAAERWLDPSQPRPAAATAYAPRYPAAPRAGELERGRAYGGLHSALLNNAPADVVDGMLERIAATPGAGPGESGPDGDTPLMAAVRSSAALGHLIERGADVNASNAWGKTALMAAAQADQPDSVRLLLQAGADRSARTRAWQRDGAGGPDNAEGAMPGRTALAYAAGSARAAVIEALAVSPDEGTGTAACAALERNARLAESDLTRLRAVLCTPPPDRRAD